MRHLTLTDREVDTILAALRLWQRDFGDMIPQELVEIAENGREGYNAALSSVEIDALIDTRLNGVAVMGGDA